MPSSDSRNAFEGTMSDDAANKVALDMMLSGEHPDAEIDKLLETFGISVS